MSELKIAGAPISWGVCEVPNWGHQMAPERVLGEMASLGFAATEFGPLGFLPVASGERAAVLSAHGMKAVGGFFPVILHDPASDPLPAVATELDAFVAAGAEVLVLSAETGFAGYNTKRPELDAAGWATLCANLDRVAGYAASRGILAVIHPHVGTLVETEADVRQVLSGANIKFCLDTGHLLIGGTDPVAFAREHAARVAHCHLKDVNSAVAARVSAGELSYYDAILAGLYAPLGEGDIDIAAIVGSLRAAGYSGWFVLEQDNVVAAEPPVGEGPVRDAARSAAFVRELG